MLTLSPFLKGSRDLKGSGVRNDKDHKERAHTEKSVSGERQVEALNRVISILLQGIAMNAFEFDAAAYENFQTSMRKLRDKMESAEDEDTALLLAGSAIRRLEEYNEGAARYVRARQAEFEGIVGLYSEAVLETSKASPDTCSLLREIEKDLACPCGNDALAEVKVRLAACLEQVRAEANPLRKGLWAAGATDLVTGLPDVGFAMRAFAEIWSRRDDYFIAAISLDRLETINLRFGFKAGDQLLTALSGHLTRNLQDDDQLFRWRGPCLVLLLERHVSEAIVSAELARTMSARLEETLEVRDREVTVNISATWNLLPLRHLTTVEDLASKINQMAAGRSPAARRMTVGAA